MKVYRLQAEQVLPIDLNTAWAFFSDPRNLLAITPPELNLIPVNELPDSMYAGQIIEYKVRIAPMVHFTWLTEITHVEDRASFVDEQRFGPYRLWHHRHTFEAVEGGTRCGDLVHYVVPGGPLAPLIHAMAIGRKLQRIFSYREQRLAERFGVMSATP